MSVTGLVHDRVIEALDDVASKIYNSYVNGNKGAARDLFRSLPEHRKAYVGYRITVCSVNDSGNIREMEAFFESVTS